MLKEKRFEFILKQLESTELLSYENLATQIGVSEDTIRRDIDYLHKSGLLSKVRGGAMQRSKNPLSFQDRENYLKQEKEVIALKAQQFITEGMTLFMDGGTTICAIASYFPRDIKIRVVTNNMILIPILMDFKNIELIVLGGRYDAQTATSTGLVTCQEVQEYIADLYFMGTCGIDANLGISASQQYDAEVKKSMLKSAKRSIALANHDHLSIHESFKICNFQEVDILITNLGSDDELLNPFRNLSVSLV